MKDTINYYYNDDLYVSKVIGSIDQFKVYEKYKYDLENRITSRITRGMNKNRDYVYHETHFHFDKNFNLLKEEARAFNQYYKYFKNGLLSAANILDYLSSYRENYFYAESIY